MFRNIKQGLQNLIYWLSVIWKDRNWDYTFLYRIMEHKLAKMEKFFIEKAISTNALEDSRNIRLCKLLLQRLKTEAYSDNLMTKHINALCRKGSIFGYEDYMINQDLDLLFKIMRKQIKNWWD